MLLVDLLYCLTLLPHYLYHRWFTNKYGDEAPEKLGRLPARIVPERPCLWVHAVSVGETQAARTLVQGFLDTHPDWEVRVSTTTATGRKVAQQHFGEDNVFYFPLDLSWMVRRAFRQVRPALVVLMELEVWPNFLACAESEGVPVAVSNVRITDRSERRFKMAGALACGMLERVSLWLSPSDEYSERLQSIGVRPERIEQVGSLKYDTVEVMRDESVRTRYRKMAGARSGDLVLVAGSTHAGEEAGVLAAYAELWKSIDRRLVLVLAPRHPERAAEVEQACASYGGCVRRTTLTDSSPAACDIVLIDTVGELGKFYAAGDIVITGGTFTPSVGGHNMMESCAMGVPTIVGPCVHNFTDPMRVLLDAEGVCQIQSMDEIAAAARRFIGDSGAAATIGDKGRSAVMSMRGATERSLSHIDALLRDRSGRI